jgi:hypothetical protein
LVQILLTSDPKMDYVPQTLITWAVKNFAYTFLTQLKQNTNSGLGAVKEVEEKLRTAIPELFAMPKL